MEILKRVRGMGMTRNDRKPDAAQEHLASIFSSINSIDARLTAIETHIGNIEGMEMSLKDNP